MDVGVTLHVIAVSQIFGHSWLPLEDPFPNDEDFPTNFDIEKSGFRGVCSLFQEVGWSNEGC